MDSLDPQFSARFQAPSGSAVPCCRQSSYETACPRARLFAPDLQELHETKKELEQIEAILNSTVGDDDSTLPDDDSAWAQPAFYKVQLLCVQKLQLQQEAQQLTAALEELEEAWTRVIPSAPLGRGQEEEGVCVCGVRVCVWGGSREWLLRVRLYSSCAFPTRALLLEPRKALRWRIDWWLLVLTSVALGQAVKHGKTIDYNNDYPSFNVRSPSISRTRTRYLQSHII